MPVVFGLSFLLSFIMSLNLAMFIGADVTFGLIARFMAGLGWVSPGIGIISLFQNRPLKYVLINARYMVVSFTVTGAISGGGK